MLPKTTPFKSIKRLKFEICDSMYRYTTLVYRYITLKILDLEQRCIGTSCMMYRYMDDLLTDRNWLLKVSVLGLDVPIHEFLRRWCTGTWIPCIGTLRISDWSPLVSQFSAMYRYIMGKYRYMKNLVFRYWKVSVLLCSGNALYRRCTGTLETCTDTCLPTNLQLLQHSFKALPRLPYRTLFIPARLQHRLDSPLSFR